MSAKRLPETPEGSTRCCTRVAVGSPEPGETRARVYRTTSRIDMTAASTAPIKPIFQAVIAPSVGDWIGP